MLVQNTIIPTMFAYGVVMLKAHSVHVHREIKYRNRINQRMKRYPDTRVVMH